MIKNTTGDSASIGRHIINFTGKVKFILYASSVSITALGVDKQILSHSSSSQISGTRNSQAHHCCWCLVGYGGVVLCFQ